MKDQPIWLVPFQLEQLIAPLSFLVGGIALGILIDRLLVRKVRKTATLTAWGGDDIIIAAMHSVVIVWFAIAGAYAALRALPLRADVTATIERGLLVLVILSATLATARLVADVIRLTTMRTGAVRGQSSLLVNIGRSVVFIIGFLLVLQAMGVQITALLTALGVGGLAVALALQDTLANLFAGVHLLASKKIQPGDFIRLDTGEDGFVVDINWRNTTIRQLPNNHIIIPNSKMADANVTNFNRPEQEMSVLIQVGVHYDSDLEQVERVVIEVGKETMAATEGGVTDFEPLVRYHTFNDSSIDFTVVLRTTEYANNFLLKHHFIKRLHKRFQEEGIVIPFPIRTLEFADGIVPTEPDRSRAGTSDETR